MKVRDLTKLDEARMRDVLVEFGMDMAENPGVTEFEAGSVAASLFSNLVDTFIGTLQEPLRSKVIQMAAMAFCIGASYAEGPSEPRH